MNLKRHVLPLVYLLVTPLLFAQGETPETSSAEASAFRAITEAMMKTRQGGDKPTEEDFKTRREAGMEMVQNARQFLKNHPASKNSEDAQGLLSIGLYEAALAGNSNAAAALQTRAAEFVNDPKIPEALKLHTFAVNHITQWAKDNGKRNLNQGSADFQKAYIEAFFAAADVLTDKEAIFKMLLLQAKSGRELSPEDKRSIAQRVFNNANASAAIQTEAKSILSGERTYTVGKSLEITFTAVDGRKVNLAEMKGKVVLIDFWATWCGPCVAEVPTLKKVYDRLHADGFEIVGISLDDKKENLIEFTKKHEMDWPQYYDGKHWNNDISFRFGINSVPTQWLVDKKGILRETNSRFNLEQEVSRLLQEK